MGMKICNATGNGICVGCNRTPPEYHGELCRHTAQNIIDAIFRGDVVFYSMVTNKFYCSDPGNDYETEEIT